METAVQQIVRDYLASATTLKTTARAIDDLAVCLFSFRSRLFLILFAD